jgi:hypothetical protein
MAEQNDVAKLYVEFEDALTDVLTESEPSLGPRRNLVHAQTRLRAHRDVTYEGYRNAVLRAAHRAGGWPPP